MTSMKDAISVGEDAWEKAEAARLERTSGEQCEQCGAPPSHAEFYDFGTRWWCEAHVPMSGHFNSCPDPCRDIVLRARRKRDPLAKVDDLVLPTGALAVKVPVTTFAPYPQPGVHIDPNTIDGDIDSLTSRATRISAEIFDLAAESIRIRDQHRTQIDAVGAELRSVKSDRDDARRDYQALALKARDAEAQLDSYLSDRSGPTMVPRATVPNVPTALLHWARMEVRRLPLVEHPDASYEVVGGVTIGDLRAWVASVDKASYEATQAADKAFDAMNAAAPADAGPQNPVVEAVRAAAGAAAPLRGLAALVSAIAAKKT